MGSEQKVVEQVDVKGKGRGDKVRSDDGGQRGSRLPHPTFAFCLLPLAFCLLFAPREQARVATPLDDDGVDEVLQRAAQSALGARDGVVLVLDAQTGRVRAALNQRGAFEEATPPGSAVKPFTMLAALRAGSLEEGTRVACRRRYKQDDFKITCAHQRYAAPFGPSQALANSCNYFFAQTALALDPDAYTRALTSFGFGAQTRGGSERESFGQLPRARPGVPEMLGDSEELRVTPAQLLTAYAALLNGGRLLVPRRARAEGFEPVLRARVEVETAHRTLILTGMRGAVAYGTAATAGLATLPVYVFGKTGTSTPLDDWHSQGWFVGFAAGESSQDESPAPADAAPPEAVRLAVLVFLKHSRGAEAAEVARPVFEAYASALARARGTQLARATSGEDESSEAALSSVDDEAGDDGEAGGESDERGAKVRVRMTRGDVTLALPLEDYVFGVVAAEGSVESQPEALKALAVVARTYALKNLRRHTRDHFDLCDTTHCQRYAPVRDESARPEFYELAHRAVRETAGEVLRDGRGRTAEVYFSAACGGRTADASKLWGGADTPAHLRGVRDEACDALSERWTDVIPSAQLLRALRADGRSDVGSRLDSVRVVRRDNTGRAEVVSLEGERRRVLRGWDFKIIVGRTLGWNLLKSSRFEVARAGSAYVFRGSGFGHGLGLCQAGAHASATRGAGYRQILARYFPGTSVGARDERAATPRDDDEGDAPKTRSSLTVERAPTTAADVEGVRAVSQNEEARAAIQPPTFQTANFQHVSLHARVSRPASLRPASFQTGRGRAFVSSEHFRLNYPSRVSRREAETFLRVLESARADVLRRVERASLAAALPDMEVFVYETTGEFVGATGEQPWVAAVTEGRRMRLQPLEALRRRGVLSTTPRHELVHAALEALGRGRAPRWLAEGLAAYVAGEGPLLARAGAARRMPTDELERRLANPASAEDARALYAAAYAEVSALIRREGESAAWRLAAR